MRIHCSTFVFLSRRQSASFSMVAHATCKPRGSRNANVGAHRTGSSQPRAKGSVSLQSPSNTRQRRSPGSAAAMSVRSRPASLVNPGCARNAICDEPGKVPPPWRRSLSKLPAKRSRQMASPRAASNSLGEVPNVLGEDLELGLGPPVPALALGAHTSAMSRPGIPSYVSS